MKTRFFSETQRSPAPLSINYKLFILICFAEISVPRHFEEKKKAKAELIFTVVSYSPSLLPCHAGNQTCFLKYPLSLLRSSVSEQQLLEPGMLVTASSHRTSRCRGKDQQHRHETRTKTQKPRSSLKLAVRVLLCFFAYREL